MRGLHFAKRNMKEILRDPLSVVFSVLLPLFLLLIFQQIDIPSEQYAIQNFTPGIVIFSFSFLTLFTATLVAKDRQGTLLTRLRISPMRPADFLLGYTLALIPLMLLQCTLFYGVALILGLNFQISLIFALIAAIPISLLYISAGILIGTFTTEKSASGVASIIVQLVAFTSGMYFDSSTVGGAFQWFCKILPFSGSYTIIKTIQNGIHTPLFPQVCTVAAYTCLFFFLSALLLKSKKSTI